MSERQRYLFLLYLANPILGNVIYEGDTELAKLFAITSINLLPPYNSVEGCTNYCDADDVLHLCEECERKFIENTLIKVPALLPVALFDHDNMENIDLLLHDLDKFRGFILLNTVEICPPDKLEYIYSHYNWLLEQSIIPKYSIIGFVNKGEYKGLPEIVRNSAKLVYRDTAIFDESELGSIKGFYQQNMEMSEVTVEEFHASRYMALKLARAKVLYPSIELPHDIVAAISNKIRTTSGVDKLITNLEVMFQETLATYIALSDKVTPEVSDINDIISLMLPKSYTAAPSAATSPFARKLGGGIGGSIGGGIGMPKKPPMAPPAPAKMPLSKPGTAPTTNNKPTATPPGAKATMAAAPSRPGIGAAPQPPAHKPPAKPAAMPPQKPTISAAPQVPVRQAPVPPTTPQPPVRPAPEIIATPADTILPVNDMDRQEGAPSRVRQTLSKKPQSAKKDKKDIDDLIDNLIDKSRSKKEQVASVESELEQMFNPDSELDKIFITQNKPPKAPPLNPPAAATNELEEEFEQIQAKLDNLIKDTRTPPAAEAAPEPKAAPIQKPAQPASEINPLIEQLLAKGPEGIEGGLLDNVIDTKSSFVFNTGAAAIKTEAELQEERAAAAATHNGKPSLVEDKAGVIEPEPAIMAEPPAPPPPPPPVAETEKPKPKPPAPAPQPVLHHTKRPEKTMTLFFGFDISKNSWSADAISNFCQILENNAFMYPVDIGVVVFNDKDSALLIEPTSNYKQAFDVLDAIVLKGKSNLADGLKIGIQAVKDYTVKFHSDMASLIVVTDGKSAYSSVPGKSGTDMAKSYAQNIASDGMNCWIVDYDNGFLRFGFAEEVAKIAKCRYSLVPSNDYNALLDKINGILSFYNEKYKIL